MKHEAGTRSEAVYWICYCYAVSAACRRPSCECWCHVEGSAPPAGRDPEIAMAERRW